MTSINELDEGQLAVISKVEKLLRLAGSNPNEAEAAAATAKAMELLAAYNLDLGMVGENSEKDTKREELAAKGGAYVYQRELWGSVAKLNFCLYWNQRKRVIYHLKTRDWVRHQYHHFFVGRSVNVVLTKTMSEYLEGAIERIMRERLVQKVFGHGTTLPISEIPSTELFSSWAVSYRTGAADRVIEKIEDRRRAMAEEEATKARAAQHAAERAGVSTSTAVTIGSFTKSEREANNEFRFDQKYGKGAWAKAVAREAAERVRQAEANRKAEEEWTRWAAAHPEEAKKEAERERKAYEASLRRANKPRATRERKEKPKAKDASAYWSGYDAGAAISIEPQVKDGASVPKLGRG